MIFEILQLKTNPEFLISKMKTMLKRKCINLTQIRVFSARSFPAIKQDTNFLESSEYTDNPKYPEILKLDLKSQKRRKQLSWTSQIEQLKTPEEKLIKLNVPRFWGFKVIDLNDSLIPYNCLPATQHYTQTIFKEEKNIEATSTTLETTNTGEAEEAKDSTLDSLIALVRKDIQDSVEFSYDYLKYKFENQKLDSGQREKLLGQLIVEQINRVLINHLSADCAHLNEIEVDINPRHEAFWSVGGIDPPKNVIKSKEAHNWYKADAHESVDRLFQYTGQPYLTVRHSKPLKPIINEDLFQDSQNVPFYKYDPRTLGFSTKYCHGTNIPGFWPGSAKGWGLISYQPRTYMHNRNLQYGSEDLQEAIHAHAIMSSFAWLIALANYNGFCALSDLTYPMYTQTIITNGREWSFYKYQLNTILIKSNIVHDNSKFNYCHGTKELKLYEEIDANGKCIGFNDEIIKHLLQSYKNAPVERKLNESELQPYLGKDVKRVADYSDPEKRKFLEESFKYISSNRPRHLEKPEIYLWEKIYKIDHNTRPLEARRRFFELNINPWARRLDEHPPKYIPRSKRPEELRRKKFRNTYYP